MLRSKPLRRNSTPIPHASGLAAKSIPKLGKRRKQEIVDTREQRAEYLRTHAQCEIGTILHAHRQRHPVIAVGAESCRRIADACHERKKRSQSGSLTAPENLLSACNNCNVWVEDYPRFARVLGLTVYSWENPQEIPKGVREEMLHMLDNGNGRG